MPVCITGMHRSGTSMVAHTLSLCGLDFGPEDQMLAADAWNSDGYWENRKLVELDDWALEELGGGWDLPPAYEANAQLRKRFVAAARGAVAEIGFREPWGWKDPRVCLLADLWQEAVADMRFVVVVRNPIEVALSLLRRGSSSAGLSLSLWSTYYSEILARLPASDRVVVTYDAFLGDPASAVERLVDRLGLDADSEQQQQAISVVDRGLRHNTADAEGLAGMPGHVVDLYEALVAEASGAAPAEAAQAVSAPKPSRAASGGGSSAGILVAAYMERDALRSEVEGLTADRDNWREIVAKLESDRDRLRGEAEALAANRDEWRKKVEALEADRDSVRSHVQRVEGMIASQQEELGRLREDRDRHADLSRSVERDRHELALERERATLRAELVEEQRAAAVERRDELSREYDALRAEAQQRRLELEQLTGEAEGLRAQVARLREDGDRFAELNRSLEHDRHELALERVQLAGEAEGLRMEVARLREDRDRYAELSRSIERDRHELALERERATLRAELVEEQRAAAVERRDELSRESDALRAEAQQRRLELEQVTGEAEGLRADVARLLEDQERWQVEAELLLEDRDRWQVEAELLLGDRDRWQVEAVLLREDRDRWQVEAGLLLEDRDRWQLEAGHLKQDRDNWRIEARNWRSEAERLIDAEQRGLRQRLRRTVLRLARRVWWAAPAGLRDRLRPVLFRAARTEASVVALPHPSEEIPPLAVPPVSVAFRRSVPEVEVPVSVVVPTWNAGDDGALFLAALERQVGVRDVELVVADSGSTDGTRDRMLDAGAVLLDVPPGEFGHGRTRNEAFAASSGEVVVMMVQDALLLGRHALRDLVLELLASADAAAVSARQVPRSHADLFAAFNVVSHHRAVWRDGRNGSRDESLKRRSAAGLDDVCAAIRRSVWEGGLQYRDVEFGEDLDLGLRAVEAGWTIRLSDSVSVAHSHNRDAPYHFRRSIADRLNIAPLVGDDAVAPSAAQASTDEIVAAGRPLLHQLAAAVALAGGVHERLSDRLSRVHRLLTSASGAAAPPTGELARLDAYFGETGSGDADDELVGALRCELAALFEWPFLVEFAAAQRGTTDDAVNSFVAKLAAAVVGRSVGDRLRVEDSPADRKRLLVGV